MDGGQASSETARGVEHALSMIRIYLIERAAHGDWHEHRVEELSQTIVAFLRRPEEPHPEPQAREERLSGAALRQAIRFINENLDSKLRWDDIAARLGLDPFKFARGFKLAAGMTPHQYVIRCRLRQAMRLLAREELTIADIALEVGCACQSHLTTLFRQHLGTTPGAFRQATRSGHRGRLFPVRPSEDRILPAGRGMDALRVDSR